MKDDIYNGRYRVYAEDTTRFTIMDTHDNSRTLLPVLNFNCNNDIFETDEMVIETEDFGIMLTMLLNAGITSTEQLHELLANAREAKNRFEDCPF